MGLTRYEFLHVLAAASPVGLIFRSHVSEIHADKTYKIAGWANVQRVNEGKTVWEVSTQNLRQQNTVHVGTPNTLRLKGTTKNPGDSGNV